VVPIFTSNHERRIYSWIAALIHHIGGKAEAFVRLEALDRLHEPDIALRDHLGDRQAIAAIPHGDLGRQAQMAGDEPMGRVVVAMLAPALGQHVFLLRFQHGEPPDLFQVMSKARLRSKHGSDCSLGHIRDLPNNDTA
jgi:hypothetical protein